jgi:hypothetical protein
LKIIVKRGNEMSIVFVFLWVCSKGVSFPASDHTTQGLCQLVIIGKTW